MRSPASPGGRFAATVLAALDETVGPVTLFDSELRIKAVIPASAFRVGRLTCARHGIEVNDVGWCPRCAPHFSKKAPSERRLRVVRVGPVASTGESTHPPHS